MGAALLPDAQGIFEVAARIRLALPVDADAISDVSQCSVHAQRSASPHSAFSAVISRPHIFLNPLFGPVDPLR
jgi:hypothetical protein